VLFCYFLKISLQREKIVKLFKPEENTERLKNIRSDHNMRISSQLNIQNKKKFNFIFFAFLSAVLFFTYSSTHIKESQEKDCNTSPFVSSAVETRLHNIDLMRHVLKKGEYEGYDIIMISSTTEEEALYQQRILEKTFAGTSKKNGRTPIILSVVDPTDGGQLIGVVYTWIKAEEMMREKHADLMSGYKDLFDYIRASDAKVAAYHNGGRGERCSPLTQSLGNSRGAQKLVGSINTVQNEEIELEVLLGVVLQCSSFATTNNGTHIDTFWTSQIAFGSHPHDKLIRSNFGINKFLVGFNKDRLIPQNIADFGTATLTKAGRMVAFYGNKRFASRKGNQYVIDLPKLERELFSKGDKVAYDFGSFSASLEMWQLLVDFWKRKEVFELTSSDQVRSKIKRDIDPHFIQPFIRLLYGINDLADRNAIDHQLPDPANLVTQRELNIAREKFDNIIKEASRQAHVYIWEDINHELDAKKKAEATTCMQEVMDFYLLYRQTPAFADLHKIFGFIDLGDETQWFRYRRPIDIMNERFEMLTDLIGKKIEVQLNGSMQEYEADEALTHRCREARRMRGIKDEEIAKFRVGDKFIILTFEEMKSGKLVEDVFVKNSIIQNCDLTRGSAIVNSVVNNVTGKVLANNSYLESSTSPLFNSMTSVIHEVSEINQIKADREVVSDVYKSKLYPPYHGRMRAPIGYDPKGMQIYKILGKNEEGKLIYSEELDETIKYFVERIPYDLRGAKEYSDEIARTEDGQFTFEEIRRIEPLRTADQEFRESIDIMIKEFINKSRLGA
jgi:hypothetical protein